jgi:glutaredoxin
MMNPGSQFHLHRLPTAVMPSMTRLPSPSLSVAARLAAFALLLGAAGAAMAQYKIVGPDGKVTYTDQPPPAAARAQGSTAANTGGGGGGSGNFPYETRQAMGRYPVALYAQKGCSPCDQARSALHARGIPFTEYSIDTNPDALQLKSRFGEMTMPVVTIGGQTLKGFRQSELDGYLDAAGYPKQAKLAGYAWPAPVPLAPPAAATSAHTTPSGVELPNGPKIDLPPPSKNGIQF